MDVLCFTEHWQKAEKIKLPSIDLFKLVSTFSRNCGEHGASCVHVTVLTSKRSALLPRDK
jgi:hypothetical protein